MAEDAAGDERDVGTVDGLGLPHAGRGGAETPFAVDLAGEVLEQPDAEVLLDRGGVERGEPVTPESRERDGVNLNVSGPPAATCCQAVPATCWSAGKKSPVWVKSPCRWMRVPSR
ncbi:MAG: hypothetical protein IPK80_01275 [Nannocystis sp.]|nr:hypothetical protein [Nannocystis sp.]